MTLLKNFIMQRIPEAEEADENPDSVPAEERKGSRAVSEKETAMWNEFMQVLADSVTATEYSTWLRCMEYVSFSEGRLTVSVPTMFVKEFIEANLLDALKKAVSVAYGSSAELFYTIRR